MTIEQIKVGFDNFSYIVYCPVTKKTAVIDPSYNVSKILDYLSSNSLELDYIILTHHHSDHSSGTIKIKNFNSDSKIVTSEKDGLKLKIKVDIEVIDHTIIKLGSINLDFLLTPGHTPGSICIIVDNEALLTGDTLFIGDCGRTDLAGGSLTQMFNSLQEKIKTLPDNLIVYPGHDYGDKPYDTLGNQKQTNKTLLAKNLDDFSKIS